MKRLFAIGLALCLGACALDPPASIPAPSTVAEHTVLDEQAVLAVELAYKAARLAVETAVDAGIIHGGVAVQVADMDNRAFTAVKAARSAYAAGNAANYGTALIEARNAITQLIAVAKK